MSDYTSSRVYNHVDVKSFEGRQSGYLCGEIESKTTGSISGSAQVYAKYVHNILSGSVGINFGPLGSLGVSGSSTYDERGAMKTFSY